ncbi:unnamed protein product [Echinostoma caproni]|uniref:WASH_WAHD domain-containing protein n=1 Tax=Echinostoma caproni TaxID=27848 RepID=A0A183A166_9TREM|nr:unnamed protein product [Echinostoma caproni]
MGAPPDGFKAAISRLEKQEARIENLARHIQSRSSSRKVIGNALRINGQLLTTDKDIADSFRASFQEVFRLDSLSNYPTLDRGSDMPDLILLPRGESEEALHSQASWSTDGTRKYKDTQQAKASLSPVI